MIYLIAVEIKGFLLVLLLTVLAGGNAFYLLVPRAAGCDAANADACSAAPYEDVWDQGPGHVLVQLCTVCHHLQQFIGMKLPNQ